MTSGICDGRVVIVTGAGRGIGREYALEFARQGARVVVNDLGSERDGLGASNGPAQEVVDEILAFGGDAIANGNDIADSDGARDLVALAIDHYGQLDVLVNNAGILRDRMIFNMGFDDWDAVIRVHLRGYVRAHPLGCGTLARAMQGNRRAVACSIDQHDLVVGPVCQSRSGQLCRGESRHCIVHDRGES